MSEKRPCAPEPPPEIARALSAADGSPPPGDHPDDLALTAYVEGRLGSSRRRDVESHLAACRDCRELAMVAAAAAEEAATLVADPEPRRARGWSRLRPAWVAAGLVALLALAPALLWLRGSGGVDLAALGVDDFELASAGPGLAAGARRLAGGGLGPVPGLGGLELADPATSRSAAGERPEALSPRWSAVTSARPRFDWMAPTDSDELELLLVDADERLIGSAVLAADARGCAYPDDLPDLEPGRVYAWRISARVGDDWLASPFVPFRLLIPAERAVLDGDLAAAGDDPLLRAVAYLNSGVDREGLVALAAVARQSEARERVIEMVGAVLRRQALPPELARRRAVALIEGPPARR